MQYTVNNELLSYTAEGDKQWGNNKVLLHDATDLSAKLPDNKQGFVIERFFPDEDYRKFRTAVHGLISELWKASGINIPDNFELDQYHTVAGDSETHFAALEKTKLLQVEMFPGGISGLEERISAICKVPLRAHNPFDDQSIFHFRVVRPNNRDNNPLHRDVWLEDFDNCINLYIPVAGSNNRSSLIIIPESHHWPESRVERTIHGAMINGIKFNVPAVTAIQGSYTMVRPDPRENELLVFSPYLIHGGSVNLNPDKTRISIEIRLWKK
jgi:hypothetical protein